MKLKLWHLILLFVILASIRSFWGRKMGMMKDTGRPEPFGADDQNYALAALEELDSAMLENRIEDIPDDQAAKFFQENGNQIALVKKLRESDDSDDQKEHMTFFHPVNTTYWPYYHYSTPYQYRSGGAWPPGMQSRLYNWQPGFASGSGWSYWLRPGISYNRWPRNRWVRQNGTFYYINNGKDRKNDYNGEPS